MKKKTTDLLDEGIRSQESIVLFSKLLNDFLVLETGKWALENDKYYYNPIESSIYVYIHTYIRTLLNFFKSSTDILSMPRASAFSQ